MNAFHVIIPSRLASTRLPRKPLSDLGGKPLVVRVLERALECGAATVHVATDSPEIADVVAAHGGDAIMTSSSHQSGTDRLAEAVAEMQLEKDEIVVNLQGDEPMVPASCLQQVARLLATMPRAEMATLWQPIANEEEWHNPNIVKLVCRKDNTAMYFSRAPIPHARDDRWPSESARRHIGLYAYRVGALHVWPSLPASPLEAQESLEQLRALAAGWTIVCGCVAEPVPPGIDTPEDLQRAALVYG